jgi:hypothetical protein
MKSTGAKGNSAEESKAGGKKREDDRRGPPLILSPQTGDVVGLSFGVVGAGDVGDFITLSFAGGGTAAPNPAVVDANGDWSSTFSGCVAGGGDGSEYVLTATSKGSGMQSQVMDITVAGVPPVVVKTVTDS